MDCKRHKCNFCVALRDITSVKFRLRVETKVSYCHHLSYRNKWTVDDRLRRFIIYFMRGHTVTPPHHHTVPPYLMTRGDI